MLEWLAFLTVLGAVLSDREDRSNGGGAPRPKHPVHWPMQTHLGEQVDMVRLFHIDLVRAYEQAPPARHGREPRDTGYQTLQDFEALRDFIHKNFSTYYWQIEPPEGQQASYHEHWIWVPSPRSPNYRTSTSRWKRMLERWPAFLDPEFLKTSNIPQLTRDTPP